MPLLPFGLSTHFYGEDALHFKPQRWVDASTAPTDPMTFMTGARDCIGQNLARLELQVVLATLLSRFAFAPSPELQRELQLAAATGQPAVTAVHELAGDFITMQPLTGHMDLCLSTRG